MKTEILKQSMRELYEEFKDSQAYYDRDYGEDKIALFIKWMLGLTN